MYDGFAVLVGHPDLAMTAVQMCVAYRAKDAVERDFHTIKSVIALRPFHHRLDKKVRAHVTLCMLALLLERTLARKLDDSQSPFTAERVLASLEGGRLNLYATPKGPGSRYQLNQLSADQAKILRTLRMRDLAQEDKVQATLTPR